MITHNSPQSSRMLLIYAIIFSAIASAFASRVTFPTVIEIDTPVTSVFWGNQSFSIGSTPVRFVGNGCDPIRRGPFPRNIIFAMTGQWCSFEQQARNAQNAGAIAVLWISDRVSWYPQKSARQFEVVGPYAISQQRTNSASADIVIPFVEVAPWQLTENILSRLLANQNVAMELSPSPNKYILWKNWKLALVFRVFLPLWSSLNILLAAYISYNLARSTGQFVFNLPQLVLITEIISSTKRIIYLSIDPVFSTGNLPYSASEVLITLHQPAAMGATIAIGMYWYAFSRNIGQELMWRKYRVWFIVVQTLLVSIEIVLATLRAMFFPIGIIGAISGILYSTMMLAVISWFVMQGWSVIRELNRRNGTRVTQVSTSSAITCKSNITSVPKVSKVRNNLRLEMRFNPLSLQRRFQIRIFWWMVLSVISMTTLIVGWTLMTTPIFYTPEGFFACWYCIFFGFNAASTTQILGFLRTGRRRAGSQSHNDSKSDIESPFRSKTSSIVSRWSHSQKPRPSLAHSKHDTKMLSIGEGSAQYHQSTLPTFQNIPNFEFEANQPNMIANVSKSLPSLPVPPRLRSRVSELREQSDEDTSSDSNSDEADIFSLSTSDDASFIRLYDSIQAGQASRENSK